MILTKPDLYGKEAAWQLLSAIDPTATPDTTLWTSLFIPDRKGPGGKQPHILHGTFENLWSEIERHTKAGFGSFFVVNQTDFLGRKSSNIVRVRALFVDADEPEAVKRCLAAIRETGATPSAIVETSPGKAHFYWMVDDVPLDQFTALQRALVDRFGTDPSVVDLPRVMRLPGTLHVKGAPQLVKLLHCSRRRWSRAELVERLGLVVGADRVAGGKPVNNTGRLLTANFDTAEARKTVRRKFGPGPFESKLAAGMTCNIAEVREAVMAIDPKAITDENGWMKMARGLAHEARGCSTQRDEIYAILDDKSKEAPGYDAEENWRRFDRYVAEAFDLGDGAITVATVFKMAKDAGWSGWKPPEDIWSIALERAAEAGVTGGVFDPDVALATLNYAFFVSVSDEEIAIFRRTPDGRAAHVPDRDFKLLVENMLVAVGRDGKLMAAERFWRTHPQRRQLRFVFKPGGIVGPEEFNLWRGFAVTPARGWRKQRRLLRHILKVICRRDKAKFRYLMQWLAWTVQHPGERPETVVMLKSAIEGSGKSTLGVVMCRLFGSHGRIVDDRDQLLGKFNGGLDTACFILADEILFAGDLRTADKLKSRITSAVLPLEEKYRNPRQVPNRMSVMMTTNHDHAAALGMHDRRFFVLEVSGGHAQDKSWFDPLYRDLDDGGYEQFLWLLQNLDLKDWHPRELLKTAEAMEQERMSADSIDQWARACIDADGLVGMPPGFGSGLGRAISTEELRESYIGFCRQHGLPRGRTGDTGPGPGDDVRTKETAPGGPWREAAVGIRRPYRRRMERGGGQTPRNKVMTAFQQFWRAIPRGIFP